MHIPPFFVSDNKLLNDAFRIAVGDIESNILPYKGGILKKEERCLMAGLDYQQPWTRDAAINSWYALAMLNGDVCKNTLLSVTEKNQNRVVVSGSYGQTWDNIIWAVGAHEYLAYNDDPNFLIFAYEVICSTLSCYEQSNFSAALNLFSGRAVYADGVASYPDNIAEKLDKEEIFALSTNCIYYRAYQICAQMAKELGRPYGDFEQKAEALKRAILTHFSNSKTKLFDYFVRESDSHEGLGLSYIILFGIADDLQTSDIFEHTHITPNGIACVWPPYDRYTKLRENAYGRHCGTIWTVVSGAWALAAAHAKKYDVFSKELFLLAEKAVRDLNFYEIYHPETGLPYGGLQEWEGNIVEWTSCRKQSWSASAYLAMLFKGIAGINICGDELHIAPYLPSNVNSVSIKNITIRGKVFNLNISRGKNLPSVHTSSIDNLAENIELSV